MEIENKSRFILNDKNAEVTLDLPDNNCYLMLKYNGVAVIEDESISRLESPKLSIKDDPRSWFSTNDFMSYSRRLAHLIFGIKGMGDFSTQDSLFSSFLPEEKSFASFSFGKAYKNPAARLIEIIRFSARINKLPQVIEDAKILTLDSFLEHRLDLFKEVYESRLGGDYRTHQDIYEVT